MNGYQQAFIKSLKKITPNKFKGFLKDNITPVPSANAPERSPPPTTISIEDALQKKCAEIARQIVQASSKLPHDHPSTLALAKLSHSLHPHNASEVLLFKAQEASGDINASSHTLNTLLDRLTREQVETNKGLIRSLKRTPTYQLSALSLLPPRRSNSEYKPKGEKLLYILNNSLPQSSNGYATRSHGVAQGLYSAGLELIIYTRPGYPWDWLKIDFAPEMECVDGVEYRRIPYPSLSNPDNHDYLGVSAGAIEQLIHINKPVAVMAASNYRNAFPALVAARRLGVPFIYEVRGFWEVTRGSREPNFIETVEFKAQELLETTTAREADMVLTLNEGMRRKLAERGVDISRIHLFPNSFSPSHFPDSKRDHALAKSLNIPKDIPVIGYIGSLVDYEGLDDLVAAAALLKQNGSNFRLLIVGAEQSTNGGSPITDSMRQTAERSGLGNWLIMPGRVPFDSVPSYYSLIDICPFPRKPWPVCELVSPLKPIEAMAMGKPLVLPNLLALEGLGRHGETALIFEKGNVQSLAQALAELVSDIHLREKLGNSARSWAHENMTWEASSAKIAPLIQSLYQSAQT